MPVRCDITFLQKFYSGNDFHERVKSVPTMIEMHTKDRFYGFGGRESEDEDRG